MKSPNDITQYKIFEGHRTKPRPKNRSESTIVFARPRNAYSKQQSMVDCIFTGTGDLRQGRRAGGGGRCGEVG